MKTSIWKKFNPKQLPPDGVYVIKITIPQDDDNPHYDKLEIRDGMASECKNCGHITHYLEGIDERKGSKGSVTLVCPDCGSFVEFNDSTYTICQKCGQVYLIN